MIKENGVLKHINKLDMLLLEKFPKKFWKDVKVIDSEAFSALSNIQNLKIPEGVEEIGPYAFDNFKNLTSVSLPGTLRKIGNGAFSFCESLEKIEIPNKVDDIGFSTFKGAKNLKEIKLPDNLTKIAPEAFSGCNSLEKLDIPSRVERIGKNAFFGCKNIKELKLARNLKEFDDSSVFGACSSVEKLEIAEGVNELSSSYLFFSTLFPNLKEVTLPKTLEKIDTNVFFNCNNLEKIDIPKNVTYIGNNAFYKCNKLKEITIPNKRCILAKDVFQECGDLEKITFRGKEIYCSGKYFPTVNYIVDNVDQLDEIQKVSKRFNRDKIVIPQELVDSNPKKYIYDNEYKYMKSLLKLMPEECRKNNLMELYSIANVMGILEKDDETINLNGKDLSVNGVAYTILQGAIKKKLLKLEDLHTNFQSLTNGKCNKEFVKFLSNKTNLEQLLNYNEQHPGFFAMVYDWFEQRKNLAIRPGVSANSISPTEEENRYKIRVYKTVENGIDKMKWNSPTIELLIKEFAQIKFKGVVDARGKELSEYFTTFNLYNQKHFDKALEIDRERVSKRVSDHITKNVVKESLIDSVEDYKKRTNSLKKDIVNTMSSTLKNQTDVASNIFTYEMLAKSDKANFAMGFLTDCCATLYGSGAGAQRAMILHPDMQPLVIKNVEGKIVCFGIIYVNRKEGYAVVNNFEVNKAYNSPQIREEIYVKAMQGVDAFVNQYNKENPNTPIQIVTSGTSPNWDAINDFIMKNPKSKLFNAPNFNDFSYAGAKLWSGDWHGRQYVIWKKDKTAGVSK